MTQVDREGLTARIREIRRLTLSRTRQKSAPADRPAEPLQALEARIAHLERQLEGLQDSVHRESERRDVLIAKLEKQVQPGTMGAALADDARNRGL
jgi:hypothetical protein